MIESQNALLDGSVHIPTNAGLLKVSGSDVLNVQGTINNTGVIALDSTGGCLSLNTPTTITGSWKVTMAGPSDCIDASSSTDPLTNQSTITGAQRFHDFIRPESCARGQRHPCARNYKPNERP